MQKTAYEMRISDWSSDVCSSDLGRGAGPRPDRTFPVLGGGQLCRRPARMAAAPHRTQLCRHRGGDAPAGRGCIVIRTQDFYRYGETCRSEEHTSELQSLMRISYAVFCLKKKKKTQR